MKRDGAVSMAALVAGVLLVTVVGSLLSCSGAREAVVSAAGAGDGVGGSIVPDDPAAEVAQRVPEFGGMFIDAEGRLTVYLTDEAMGAEVLDAIAEVFGPDRIPAAGVRFIQGQYGYLELREWRELLAPLWEIEGVSSIGIDQTRNRLRVGLETGKVRNRVERQVAELGIPPEAVLVEETGPVQPR